MNFIEMKESKQKYKQFFILFLLLLVLSCKKNSLHPVPSIPFDINIYLNLPSYNSLESVGGWAYVNGGSKGIVLYRKSSDEFVAFDRHSPANEGLCDQALITNSDNFLQLDDLCSEAKFSLYDGSIISGSEFGLRQYQTFWDGGNSLRIYN
jgi:hypothetical protein